MGPEQFNRKSPAGRPGQKTFLSRAAGYIKRTGPGLLQSHDPRRARTASVVAGARSAKLLWVQPLAMFLGVMMLAALGASSVDRRSAYKAFGAKRASCRLLLGPGHDHRLGHLAFPQYGLAAGARDLAMMAGIESFDAEQQYTTAGWIVSFAVGG